MATVHDLRQDALAIFNAALAVAHAGDAVRRHLHVRKGALQAGRVDFDLSAFERVVVIAVGKAAPQMAEAVEEQLGSYFSNGVVITKHGHAKTYQGRCKVIETGHPVPDEDSLRAGYEVLQLIEDLTPEHLLIVAVSGGASSLLCAPVPAITLQAKQQTTDVLLRAGADIHELNCVRKHLSMLKGGQLALRAHPAPILSLILSDVVGDPLDVIGSGLTAPDESTFSDALAVLTKRSVLGSIPIEVKKYLQQGAKGDVVETPKPGDAALAKVSNLVVGNSRQALESAAVEAKRRGYHPLILSSLFQGEARDVARFHAEILTETKLSGHPTATPACLLSGGETTVTVRGNGKGGRNQEFALSLALAIEGMENAMCLSAGTDGTDGPTDAAGALAAGDTVQRARKMAMDASDYLARNDSFSFFQTLGDLVVTGPTGTNVMDVNIMLVR